MPEMDDRNESNRGQKIVKGVQAREIDTALPVTIIMRAYYSSYHLWAAKHLSELARSIENQEGERPRFDIKHRAYVTNSILSAVAFLEAAMNELFQYIADGHESYIAPLDAGSKREISEFWQRDQRKKKRRGVFAKYQSALTFLRKQQFAPGQPPYLDGKLVV